MKEIQHLILKVTGYCLNLGKTILEEKIWWPMLGIINYGIAELKKNLLKQNLIHALKDGVFLHSLNGKILNMTNGIQQLSYLLLLEQKEVRILFNLQQVIVNT